MKKFIYLFIADHVRQGQMVLGAYSTMDLAKEAERAYMTKRRNTPDDLVLPVNSFRIICREVDADASAY